MPRQDGAQPVGRQRGQRVLERRRLAEQVALEVAAALLFQGRSDVSMPSATTPMPRSRASRTTARMMAGLAGVLPMPATKERSILT